MEISTIIWLSLFIVFIVYELLTTFLVSVWFAAGAFIALITAFIAPKNYALQVSIFTAVSIASFVGFRPLVKKISKQAETIPDSKVGEHGIVTERIAPKGYVKINDVEWYAISNTNKIIKKGEPVIVTKQNGNTLTVEKIDEVN